ncbi:alkaline phosphatase family protein [Humisphaera borealis]|uniref:Alkaline phosphatase family protein n=1 Tax=Humisphaera borealis TaxID=2807512 RepID=A0A7M2WZ87_9BACT|nr:ectonucleotide pyrophosphatase/phosphodiesterase [Humisphaera borealis]QOV90512.1 alkaline phosphatase family protein [Humisphaera borealis]
MSPRIRCSVMLLCLTGLTVAVAVAADKSPASKTKVDAGEAEKFPKPKWIKEAEALAPTTRPATRPVDGADHVLIVSIDGLRPDIMLRGEMPNVHRLYKTGAFSFWAKTTPNSITLPSHTSMLTGVDPRKHGIEWNADLPLSEPVYPKVPTVFFYARKAGYKTGMAAGKSKFDVLDVKGTLDGSAITDKKTDKDDDVAHAASKIIRDIKPQLMFVHLPGVDNAGHRYKWGSPEQMKAVAAADYALGRVLDAYRDAEMLSHTVVIVTADHGGTGLGHGPDDPRSRHIPWIANGPGVRENFDLTTDDELNVRTEDTFATACWLLNAPHGKIDGRPVTAAFALPVAELLTEVAPAK